MRRFVFVSLICVSILAMTACGSTRATTPTPGSNGTAVEQGVLRVAALYDISTMDVSQTTDDYMVPIMIPPTLCTPSSAVPPRRASAA